MKKALTIVFLTALVLFTLNLDITSKITGKISGALAPLLLGVFFALLIKAPVDFLENTILSSPKLGKARRPLALGISLVFAVGLLVLIGYLVVPELIKSITALKESLEWMINGGLEEVLKLPKEVVEWLKKGLEAWLKQTDKLVPYMVARVGNTLKSMVSILFGLMLGVTMLLGNGKGGRMLMQLGIKIFGEKKTEFLGGAIKAVTEKFSKYLGGSTIEALLFSLICYLIFLIFKVPYALLLAVVVGIFNLVPTVGGLVGGVIGVIILAPISLKSVLTFVIITLVLQQIEQVTTYPIVVGKYVGLSPFMVLLAVVVGGGLFGFWGFMLGVPIVAFVYNLILVVTDCETEKVEMRQN